MKKKKNKLAMLNAGKGIKPLKKENKMRNQPEVYEDSVEEMDEDIPEAAVIKRPPGVSGMKSGKPRGPDWSQEEIEYIIQTCEASQKVTHGLLNEIADALNKYLHDKKDVRSGSGIWWMLKRGQEKGKYSTITIPGGAPKNAPAKNNVLPEPRMNVRGAVERAVAPPKAEKPKKPILPPMNVGTKSLPRPAAAQPEKKIPTATAGGGKFFAVVENSDGRVIKIQTRFNTYEEFIFAVT